MNNLIQGPWETEKETILKNKINNRITEINELTKNLKIENTNDTKVPIHSTLIKNKAEEIWSLWQELVQETENN